MIRPAQIHLLLTYKCISECDHCFVWGGPTQEGTMTAAAVERVLRQAEEAGGIDWIWFEGGEPFVYFPLLEWAVRQASEAGFKVGVVTNGYWAVSSEDAPFYLRPLQPYLSQLDVSRDDYHSQAVPAERAGCAAPQGPSAGRGKPRDVPGTRVGKAGAPDSGTSGGRIYGVPSRKPG